MSIETLKDRLPEYAKDLKLNLSTLASETVLDEERKAVHAVAVTLETGGQPPAPRSLWLRRTQEGGRGPSPRT